MPATMVLIILALTLNSAVAASHVALTRLPAPGEPGQTIALHCVAPPKAASEAVLFIHGASFPTMLAAGFEFKGGDSWMDFTAARGFLACGLDFLGYGASSRPSAMSRPAEEAAPLVRAPEAATQIAAAANYLRDRRGISRLHIVAHSWGTIPAATYAAGQPAALASLTLFGPVVPVPGYVENEKPVAFAWWSIAARERYQQLRFTDVLPAGMHLLESAVDRKWAKAFANSQPREYRETNGVLRIPAGCIADIHDANAGKYPYRQRDVTVPVFVVYGNYDAVVNDAGGIAFLAEFTSSPLKWRLRIDDGTHVMLLERNRRSLYQSVAAFIATVNGSSRRAR